jgi:multidrug efflux pump subunit AcrB
MVVLFSLILALGMLVDNAIVIVENVFRHMQEGKPAIRAAKIAAAEVGWPVISSTLTTLCAFFPMTFWPGIMGEFMKYLPITLIVTLTASLFVALVINPTLCGHFMSLQKKTEQAQPEPAKIIQLYRRTLEFALAQRLLVVSASFALLIGIVAAYAVLGHGVELFPDIEPNRAFVEIKAPEGTSLAATDQLALKIEEFTAAEQDVRFTISEVGTASSDMGGDSVQSNLGKISLDFLERDDRAEDSREVLDRIRSALSPIPGAEFKVEKQPESTTNIWTGGSGSGVSTFPENFLAASSKVTAVWLSVGGVSVN